MYVYRARGKVITSWRCTLFCEVRAEAVAYVPSTVLAYSVSFCCQCGLVLCLFCPYLRKNAQETAQGSQRTPQGCPRDFPLGHMGGKANFRSHVDSKQFRYKINAIHKQLNATQSNSDICRLYGACGNTLAIVYYEKRLRQFSGLASSFYNTKGGNDGLATSL